jgi:hypothetical protein
LPSVAVFDEITHLGELRHSLGVYGREPEHQRLDAGERDVAGFELGCDALQTAMAATDDLIALWSVGATQEATDLIRSRNSPLTDAFGVIVAPRNGYAA